MASLPDLFHDEPDTACEPLGWIHTRPGLPYFLEGDRAWTPIGQNDAVSWPELNGLFRRRDLPGVEAHLRALKQSGVTCLRLMLEYAQGEHRYFERPVGAFQPHMVRLWDDLFALCERVGLRLLLTPFDTFFTWTRWQRHPYNAKNGGPCASRGQLIACPAARAAIKNRLEFATRRWGGSGALFAWDLWNEAHPAHGGDDPAAIARFIDDVAPWIRALETRVHGRAHPLTVSIFGPELLKHPELCDPIFRHPHLDFANTHLYESGTIDNPRDTVVPAIAAGRLMRAAVQDAADGRPVFDSEHGPIHAFKDRRRTLPDAFDDEYFRHIQWAHLASGGAGGGMRWPNRNPHVLTPGMRHAQGALSRFLPLIDWTRFRRRNLSDGVELSTRSAVSFACGDERQAILWLLRRGAAVRGGPVRTDLPPIEVTIGFPGLSAGNYVLTLFDTTKGWIEAERRLRYGGAGPLRFETALGADLAVAIRKS